jgi:glycerol kinase
VDGGATANNLLMQFQSDMLDTKVVRPVVIETTAIGAAYLAGLAVGFWSSLEEIQAQWQMERVFSPEMGAMKRINLGKEWTKAINSAIKWTKE